MRTLRGRARGCSCVWLSVATAILLWLPSKTAHANSRSFSYTYESATLPYGTREVELWSTARLMKDSYYLRFDERIEFEIGLGRGVQTAFYLNFRGIAKETATDVEKSFDFRGLSNEWKWEISNAVADVIGSALYGEVTWMPHEIELEAKLILDKRIGPFLFAYNIVGEVEFEIEKETTAGVTRKEWNKSFIMEHLLALAGFITEQFSLGLEFRSLTIWKGIDLDFSALFLGPALAYKAEGWWMTLTFLPQLPAIRNSSGSPDRRLVLDGLERYEARLLMGFHF
ncbi:MAG: hypothetical protein GXP54_11635 [Deltaproteobacteria bacterium]|nr:hypothetical protein [Deltaproteobacteria bacterium]